MRWAEWTELLAYAGPPNYDNDGIEIDQFQVDADSIENLRLGFDGRACEPGVYHRLLVDGQLWMSDTSAELRDHLSPVLEMRRRQGDVLIHDLGLGLVVAAAIRTGHDVDVVELDPRVGEAVGPSMQDLASRHNVDCRIHIADAYEHRFEPGRRWAVVWHDIWPSLCVDNLQEMARLHRRYGGRADWQGSWCKELLKRHRQRMGSMW